MTGMDLLLVALGGLIGAVLGLTGAGGSVLAVPLLVLVLGIDPVSATGLALGIVASSAAFGSIQRIRHREILWIPALFLGISGVMAAPVGRMVSAQVPPGILTGGFALLTVIIAASMVWQSIRQPQASLVVRAGGGAQADATLLCRFSETQRFDWRFRCMAGLTAGGLLTGLLSGAFGVGGGFMIVPFLNQLNGVSIRSAVATSLVIIAAVATSGFMTHLVTIGIDWAQLPGLGAGGVLGMAAGSVLARWIAGVTLQRLFAATIVAMAGLMLIA